MESDSEPEPEAVPYVTHPETPWWFPIAGGVWAGLLVIGIAGLQARSAWGLVILVAASVVAFVFLARYRRLSGFDPSLHGASSELAEDYKLYFVGLILIVGATAALYLFSPLAAAACAAVLVGLGLWLYGRRYERAEAEFRRRVE